VGVIVEEGPQSFHVKVNCKDRHGLLSDITQALKELPLEVGAPAMHAGCFLGAGLLCSVAEYCMQGL
jgi:hypothetical protein